MFMEGGGGVITNGDADQAYLGVNNSNRHTLCIQGWPNFNLHTASNAIFQLMQAYVTVTLAIYIAKYHDIYVNDL